MSARMATLALVSAAGLLMSSCSFIGGSQTEAEEPGFTEAVAESVTSSATTTSSTATSTSSSASSSSTDADCDEKKDLEDTELSKVLENGEAYVKGSTEKLEDVNVGEDEYDPCKFLSYVVLEGEFDGEDVKAPVFFSKGELKDEDALYITSSSLEVEEDGEGYTYESETEGDIVGVEGKVNKRPGTEATSMENSFDGVTRTYSSLTSNQSPLTLRTWLRMKKTSAAKSSSLFPPMAGTWSAASLRKQRYRLCTRRRRSLGHQGW